MKIFNRRFGIAFCFTMLFLIGILLMSVEEIYATPALRVPEITSFGKSNLEDNALKLIYKTNNTGTNFSIEVIEATTKGKNNLSGSATSYTYQNLKEGQEYKVQVRACTNSVANWDCTEFSEVRTAIAGFRSLGIKSIKLNTTKFVYNGKVKTPGVTVIDDNNNTLTKGTDYTVTLPSKRTAIGKYKVTVKGQGKYGFSKKLSFVIRPPKPVISKVISTKNSITVKYKKAKGGVKYQVGYKKSSAKKYKYLSSTSALSKKITGLSSGTKYNVVVRCTKKVNNVNYIGANSSKKTKKTVSKSKNLSTPKFKVYTSGNSLSVKIDSKKMDVDGFEIQRSKDFLWLTGITRTVSMKNAGKKITMSVKNPSQYYVRVRSYVVINGKKYYSKYRVHKATKGGLRQLSYVALTGTKAGNCIRSDPRLAGYSVHQAACTDNNGNVYMVYTADYHSNEAGIINKTNKNKIVKISPSGKILKVSGNMRLGHANGMCYDSKRKKLIITRSAVASDYKVSVVDPNTFKYSYKTVKGASGGAFNDISYDARTNTFLMHRLHSSKVLVTDANFKVIKSYKVSASLNQGSTTYSTTLSDKYGHQYYLMAKSHSHSQTKTNYIKIVDIRRNKIVQTLNMPYKSEIENVWVYNDHLYCSVHKHISKRKGTMGSGIIFKLY